MAVQAFGLPDTLTLEQLSTDEENEIFEHFPPYRRFEKLFRVSPGGWFVMGLSAKVVHHIYNFRFNPSDMVVMTFPKCGTMWMMEIIWTMRHNPNLDHPRATEVISDRCKHIDRDVLFNTSTYEETHPKKVKEFKRMFPGRDPSDGMFVYLAAIEEPERLLRTHLPFSFYNPDNISNCKVVYVARNARDAALSFYEYSKLLTLLSYTGSLEEYINLFMEDKLVYSPYWEHVTQAWQRRDQANVHFVFYEDLKSDPIQEIRRLDKFLETNLKDQQIKNVVDYVSFQNMKRRDNQNGKGTGLYQQYMKMDLLEKGGGFYRKGEVGSWKDVQLSKEQEEKFSKWIAENEEAAGIKFSYE